MPLNPYLRGQIVAMLLRELKPAEGASSVPSDLFTGKGEEWMAEYTTYRSWLSSWLKWSMWHAKASADPNPSIPSLFDAPIIGTMWKTRDPDLC